MDIAPLAEEMVRLEDSRERWEFKYPRIPTLAFVILVCALLWFLLQLQLWQQSEEYRWEDLKQGVYTSGCSASRPDSCSVSNREASGFARR